MSEKIYINNTTNNGYKKFSFIVSSIIVNRVYNYGFWIF